MKCLIVVPSLRRAGAETQAVDLANGLAAAGHAVHVCSFEPQLEQRARLSAAVRFHHVRRKSKYDLSFVAGIAQIIDQERIEVVQGVMQFAVLFAWLAAARSRLRPPVVAALHTTINRGLKEELHDRLLYRWILRRLPAVIFVCEYQRSYWVAKYPELQTRARVVYNGVDPERYCRAGVEGAARDLRQRLEIPEDAFVFACIAAFRPEKGHDHLIEAFSTLSRPAYLLLAGEGERMEVTQQQVRATGLENRVRFLGVVEDVRPVIVASDATILASTAVETFSMAMLESMALEVPMIATAIGGLAEAIIHGETGMLCTPGDPGSLAAAMESLAGRGADARSLGRAASALVVSKFTLQGMVAGNEAVLADVLSSRASSAAGRNSPAG
jgi:glycosyltransferase involved in cell wall biosynthesis